MSIRLFLLASLLLGWGRLSAQSARHHATFVKRVTRKMAYVAMLDAEFVGRYPFTTRQFMRFDSLRRHCGNAELQLLTEHKSAVVRSYAFWALSERSDAELLPVLLRHHRDTVEFEQRNGCVGSTHDVAEFMLQCYKVSRQYRADSLVTEQQAVVAKLDEQSTARFMRRYHRYRDLGRRQRQHYLHRQHKKYQQLLARNDG